MPHDRKGQKLEVGDQVFIPVTPLRFVQVVGSEAAPDEYRPQLAVHDGPEEFLNGTVTQIYEAEDACNADFEIVGMPGKVSFNTRLVEKLVEPVAAATE